MARLYATSEQEKDEVATGVKWPLHRLSRHENYEEVIARRQASNAAGVKYRRKVTRETQKKHGGLYNR
jgi:hypothetical protein